MANESRWDEARTERRATASKEETKKIVDIVRACNSKGTEPTTREVTNIYKGLKAADVSLPNSAVDQVLQNFLDPLRKQGKLQAKYWHQNQLIWRVTPTRKDKI